MAVFERSGPDVAGNGAQMNIAVFGAGYVGCVTAACLARIGHRVWLVEIAEDKLALLRAGVCPILEPMLDEELVAAIRSGMVVATNSDEEAVASTELALLCVGTPSQVDGSPNLAHLEHVFDQLARQLAQHPRPYVIALRSTVPYGDVKRALLPRLMRTLGDRLGGEVGFAVHPEFLREGEAIQDFLNPPFIVIGTDHEPAALKLKEMYRSVEAPFAVVSPGTASLLKYACNAFHALKVSFANEIASVEGLFEADANKTMELFCLDRILNISPAYLRPGYAFGGACLPKDLRALNRVAVREGVSTPVLGAVLASNDELIRRSILAVERLQALEVALVGLSFKPGTDDLRESPLVELAQQLTGKGCRLRIYDPDVKPRELRGRNLTYVMQRLSHLSLLLCATPDAALKDSELVIVGKKLLSADELEKMIPPGTPVLDLTRSISADGSALRVLQLDGIGSARPAHARPCP